MIRHQLMDMLVIAICATICGADHWTDIEEFGKSNQDWFETFLELPHGIPSHDTFTDLFRYLSAKAFAECFRAWTESLCHVVGGDFVGLDGKLIRHSRDRKKGKGALQMVSAWSCMNHMVLGQLKVEQDSNEITAIPKLLRTLFLENCIVTLDAMHCQKQTAQAVFEQGADYVIALKENQRKLYEAVDAHFEQLLLDEPESESLAFTMTEDNSHGRFETRRYWMTEELSWLEQREDWKGLRSVGLVERERTVNGEKSYESHLYISSLECDIEEFALAVRSHWEVENKLHWVLDIAFREDESRVRRGHGAENLAILRKMALNLLKQEKTHKGGIRAKRMKAGWDRRYLLRVLNLLGN